MPVFMKQDKNAGYYSIAQTSSKPNTQYPTPPNYTSRDQNRQ